MSENLSDMIGQSICPFFLNCSHPHRCVSCTLLYIGHGFYWVQELLVFSFVGDACAGRIQYAKTNPSSFS